MNLPNALTLLRIVMIPAFVYLYRLPEYQWALLTYLLASATDFFDGYFARKWNQITTLGKLFDPLADKLMLVAVLACLAQTGYIPWWLMIVVSVKELVMMAGAFGLLNKEIVVQANWLGKVATVAFILAIFAVFPWHDYGWLRTAGNVLIYVALALSLAALVNYSRGFLAQFRKK